MKQRSGPRVCLVAGYRPTPGGGGTEKHIYELACGLLERGLHVDILCEDRSFLPDETSRLEGHILGIAPQSVRECGWLERYLEKSRLFARRLNPDLYDVVHAHNHYGFDIALRLARLHARPRLVSTFHLTPLGVLKRFEQLGLPEPDGAPIDRAVGIMERTQAYLSDWCVGVSRAVAREIRELYGVPGDRVSTIYNWYDSAVFKPRPLGAARAELGLDATARYLIYVGHFGEFRGQVLVDAFRLLPGDVRLVVVHPEEDLEVKAEFRERVLFTGYIPPKRLALYFAAADLQCFPPVYGAFGLVLIEGMACGCPPVVFNFPAMNEIVTSGSGYLVDTPDAPCYASAIQRALEDGSLKRAEAQRRAGRFDMQMQIDEVAGVYESVLGREKPKPRVSPDGPLLVERLKKPSLDETGGRTRQGQRIDG